jgi:hypothetical protein
MRDFVLQRWQIYRNIAPFLKTKSVRVLAFKYQQPFIPMGWCRAGARRGASNQQKIPG